MTRIGRVRLSYRMVLLAILILAAVLRFAGLNWDGGYYLHPDERFMVMVTVDTSWPDSIGQYFDSETSPLNPYNTRHGTFIYGTFPMFLTKAVSTLLGKDIYGETHLAGRAISALADTGTVFLVAWIARRFFGRQAGLLAGFLFACTVLHIQTAHYYTVDAISVFFAIAAFATTVKSWDRRSFGWFALAGLMIGLAGASKPNYLIALAFLALPVAETIRLRGWEGLLPWSNGERHRFPILPAISLAGMVAFWTFRIAQPYAFSGPSIWNIRLDQRWLDDLGYWQRAQSGLIDIKSSIQWVDRTPVVYILDNLVRWGMGPPLGIAALAGLALLVIRLVRAESWPSWWMLGMGGWCVAQLVLYGTNMAQAQRYLMPIYPFLVVFAAGLLVELTRRLHQTPWMRTRPAWVNPGALLIGITVIYTLFYAVAFDSLFVRPLSRVQASEWIYEHVPSGSTLTSEYWDDGLPMRLEGEDSAQYRYITLDLYAYEGPGSLKLSKLIGQINQADYIILSSNRIIGSVPRQPERYPMASHYYEMLLNGDLGFDLVAEFSQKPELFGIALDDTDAEETLTVYEHPYVRIFKKAPRFDDAAVYNELNAALGYGGVNYLPGDPTGEQMLLSPEESEAASANGTWRTRFDPDSLVNAAPALWWYLALQIMIVPALPIAWLLFRRFPDHGYAAAKILGLLLVTWIAWLLAATDLVPFGRTSIALSWLIVLVSGVWCARLHLTDMSTAFRARWRWLLATELLFLAAFGGMIWVRSLNPGFWQPGGESQSPFWYAIFNASLRSDTFPAYDPWFSGGKLHLSNWGQMPWVMLTRLTGILPATAWNLAFAGIFALTCITIWSAAAGLVSRIGQLKPLTGWLALLAPLTAVFGATLILARRAGQGAWGYPTRPGDYPVPGLPGDIVYGTWNLLTERRPLPLSVARDALRLSSGSEASTPFASMLAGNLDSGTTTLPIIALLLVVAIAIALSTTSSSSPQWPLDRLDLTRILLGGGLAGAMLASTTWGFLPAMGLMTIAIAIQLLIRCQDSPPGIIGNRPPVVVSGPVPETTARSTSHTFLHPTDSRQTQDTLATSWPLVRNCVLCLLLAGVSAYVAFWPAIQAVQTTQRDMRTGPAIGLDDLLALMGMLFLVLLTWLVIQATTVMRRAHEEGWPGRLIVLSTIILIAGVFTGTSFLNSSNLFILAAMLLGFIALWHLQDQPAPLVVLGLTMLALTLVIMRNLMPMIADPFGQNPARNLEIFIWLLAGVAMTAAFGWIMTLLDMQHRPLRMLAGGVWITIITIMLVAGLAFPAITVRALNDNRGETPLTLDATRFLDYSAPIEAAGQIPLFAGDRDATRWLMTNVTGLPVILEAMTGDSQPGGRISAMTGLPTVVGWNTPERMMRPGWTELVSQRQIDVSHIYGSRGDFASIEPLLQQYDVEYIYVGSIERALYAPASLQKFTTAGNDGTLQIAYASETVTIYYYSA